VAEKLLRNGQGWSEGAREPQLVTAIEGNAREVDLRLPKNHVAKPAQAFDDQDDATATGALALCGATPPVPGVPIPAVLAHHAPIVSPGHAGRTTTHQHFVGLPVTMPWGIQLRCPRPWTGTLVAQASTPQGNSNCGAVVQQILQQRPWHLVLVRRASGESQASDAFHPMEPLVPRAYAALIGDLPQFGNCARQLGDVAIADSPALAEGERPSG
jgi:hypothetical protein